MHYSQAFSHSAINTLFQQYVLQEDDRTSHISQLQAYSIQANSYINQLKLLAKEVTELKQQKLSSNKVPISKVLSAKKSPERIKEAPKPKASMSPKADLPSNKSSAPKGSSPHTKTEMVHQFTEDRNLPQAIIQDTKESINLFTAKIPSDRKNESSNLTSNLVELTNIIANPATLDKPVDVLLTQSKEANRPQHDALEANNTRLNPSQRKAPTYVSQESNTIPSAIIASKENPFSVVSNVSATNTRKSEEKKRDSVSSASKNPIIDALKPTLIVPSPKSTDNKVETEKNNSTKKSIPQNVNQLNKTSSHKSPSLPTNNEALMEQSKKSPQKQVVESSNKSPAKPANAIIDANKSSSQKMKLQWKEPTLANANLQEIKSSPRQNISNAEPEMHYANPPNIYSESIQKKSHPSQSKANEANSTEINPQIGSIQKDNMSSQSKNKSNPQIVNEQNIPRVDLNEKESANIAPTFSEKFSFKPTSAKKLNSPQKPLSHEIKIDHTFASEQPDNMVVEPLFPLSPQRNAQTEYNINQSAINLSGNPPNTPVLSIEPNSKISEIIQSIKPDCNNGSIESKPKKSLTVIEEAKSAEEKTKIAASSDQSQITPSFNQNNSDISKNVAVSPTKLNSNNSNSSHIIDAKRSNGNNERKSLPHSPAHTKQPGTLVQRTPEALNDSIVDICRSKNVSVNEIEEVNYPEPNRMYSEMQEKISSIGKENNDFDKYILSSNNEKAVENKSEITPIKKNEKPQNYSTPFLIANSMGTYLKNSNIDENLPEYYKAFVKDKTHYDLTESDLDISDDRFFDSDYFEFENPIDEDEDKAFLSDHPDQFSVKRQLISKNSLELTNAKVKRLLTKNNKAIAQWASDKKALEQIILYQQTYLRPEDVFNPNAVEQVDLSKFRSSSKIIRNSSANWKNDINTPILIHQKKLNLKKDHLNINLNKVFAEDIPKM